MQPDRDIPTRGARYFSQPKRAEGPVQTCQQGCVHSKVRRTSSNAFGSVKVTLLANANTIEVGEPLPGVPTAGLFFPSRYFWCNHFASEGGNTTIAFNHGGYIELQDGTTYTCQTISGCEVVNGFMTAGAIVRGPVMTSDLVVEELGVSDSSPDAGETFTLSATVRNRGSGSAGSTRLWYYNSTDAAIDRTDTSVGTDSVSRLAGSESSAQSISLAAPSTAGTYYYGACVDAVSDETNTGNNCSSALVVTVQATGGRAPNAPAGLTATGNGSTQIDLSWTASTGVGSSPVTGYRVEVSEDGFTWSDLVANTGTTATHYSDSGLAAGTTRHYRVSAINAAGTGPASNVAVATTDQQPSTAQVTAGDYDADDDGLIEIANLSQLNAVRWDSDGDGQVLGRDDRAQYRSAYPGAADNMGCPGSGCTGYELVANLNFDTNGNGQADSGDAYWNNGAGWQPIGTRNSPFAATLDGNAHTISNLYIRDASGTGLFGVLHNDGSIKRVGLVDVNAARSGYGSAGALVGTNNGSIEDSYAKGLVAACVDNLGGLVGTNNGSIANSHSAGEVRSARRTGGGGLLEGFQDLIGVQIFGASGRTCYTDGGGLVGQNTGSITDSHSTSEVSGFNDNFGGLVGSNRDGVIDGSYAAGDVSGNGYAAVGGLVGRNGITYADGVTDNQGQSHYGGTIIASYAIGSVSGTGDNFGGLAGDNSGVIVASYATGSVSARGHADVGGLVGDNRYTGVITAAYAQGSVSGKADNYGGLVGANQGVITFCFSTGKVPPSGGGLIERNGNYGSVADCYWDTETSDQYDSSGGDGKTTAELQSPIGYTGLYSDWNVDLDRDGSSDNPWIFGSATEYPALNLETLNIEHDNLNTRPPLEPKPNAALCSAVNYSDIAEVKAQIEAGIDVNDTCQSTTAWYDGLTPLAIAQRYGRTEIEAILVEAGAVAQSTGDTGASGPAPNVANNPPIIQPIANREITIGTNLTVAVSASDADSGDTLTYRAASSNTAVAMVAMSGNALTVTQVATGKATITVTVSDGQVDVSTTFVVTVTPSGSTPAPVLGEAPDLIVDAPTLSGSSLATGASFTLEVTVHNQGKRGVKVHHIALLSLDRRHHHGI